MAVHHSCRLLTQVLKRRVQGIFPELLLLPTKVERFGESDDCISILGPGLKIFVAIFWNWSLLQTNGQI
jgi:hypothetical protein